MRASDPNEVNEINQENHTYHHHHARDSKCKCLRSKFVNNNTVQRLAFHWLDSFVILIGNLGRRSQTATCLAAPPGSSEQVPINQ
jgi:hypothetical protein